MTAYRQWSEARELHAAWRRLDSKDRLGKEGSFFVVMGGYAVGLDMSDSVFPSILTAKGLLDLIEAGVIREDAIVKKEIKDKGNTDEFGKAVVCIQAGWMLIQCAIRKLCDLPLTILEVHAVMHILCAAGMYFFWWNKPLDVNEPITLVPDPNLARILSVTCNDYHKFDFQIEVERKIKSETEVRLAAKTVGAGMTGTRITIKEEADIMDAEVDAPAARYFLEDSSTCTRTLIQRPIDTVIFFHHDGNSAIPLGKPSRYSPYKHWGFFTEGKANFRDHLGSNEPGTIAIFQGERLIRENSFSIACEVRTGLELRRAFLKPDDLQTLHDVASAIRSGNYNEYIQPPTTADDEFPEPPTPGCVRLCKKYANAFVYPPLDLRLGDRLRVGMGEGTSAYLKWIVDSEYKFRMLIILFILYSAGHATAWDNYFPTDIERWSWRASCIIVAVSPLAFYTNYKLRSLLDPRWGRSRETEESLLESQDSEFRRRPSWRKLDPNFRIWEANRSSYLWGVMFVAFSMARVFMTLEAFVSLRQMPKAVYKTVGWEGYWPHAG